MRIVLREEDWHSPSGPTPRAPVPDINDSIELRVVALAGVRSASRARPDECARKSSKARRECTQRLLAYASSLGGAQWPYRGLLKSARPFGGALFTPCQRAHHACCYVRFLADVRMAGSASCRRRRRCKRGTDLQGWCQRLPLGRVVGFSRNLPLGAQVRAARARARSQPLGL